MNKSSLPDECAVYSLFFAILLGFDLSRYSLIRGSYVLQEYQKKASSSAPKPATSYRKKKVEKSDLADEIESYEDPTTKLY